MCGAGSGAVAPASLLPAGVKSARPVPCSDPLCSGCMGSAWEARSAHSPISIDLGSPLLSSSVSLSLFYFSLSFVSLCSPRDSQPLSTYIYTSVSLSVLLSVFLSPYLSFSSPYPDPGSSASAAVCLHLPVSLLLSLSLSPSSPTLSLPPSSPPTLIFLRLCGPEPLQAARPQPWQDALGHFLVPHGPSSFYQLEMNQRLGNGGVGLLSPSARGALS